MDGGKGVGVEDGEGGGWGVGGGEAGGRSWKA